MGLACHLVWLRHRVVAQRDSLKRAICFLTHFQLTLGNWIDPILAQRARSIILFKAIHVFEYDIGNMGLV